MTTRKNPLIGDEAEQSPDEYTVQLKPPTLDERANFYLRAVYGPREFTNEDYSQARALLLDRMAVDISRRPENSIQGPIVSGHPIRPEREVLVALACALPSEELSASYERRETRTTTRMAERKEDLSLDVAVAALIARPDFAPPSNATGRVKRYAPSRLTKWGVAVIAAVSVAGTAAFLLAGLFPTAMSPTARSTDVQTPTWDFQASLLDAPKPAQPIQLRKTASASNSPQLSADDIAALLKRGQELIAAGDFRAGRLVLIRAVDAGSAEAALQIALSYEPGVLEKETASIQSIQSIHSTPFQSTPSNPEMARAWYEKARDLGSPVAARRLEQLSTPTKPKR